MKSVCVYCGANEGHDPAFAEAARALGNLIVDRNMRLVFGGGKVGLMGVIADTVMGRGGEALGVIPDALVGMEVAHKGLTHQYVVRSMHERKAMMAALSDGYIAMPGGVGTLEEISEVWTGSYLGFHNKPCGLLNVNGFYDPLIEFIERGSSEGFIRPSQRASLLVDANPQGLLDRFEEFLGHESVIKA